MKIGIVGAAGRMGRMLVSVVGRTPNAQLAGGTEASGSRHIGKSAVTLEDAGPDAPLIVADPAAFGGLKTAERKFSKLSGNTLHFARAPEYFLTTNIAEQLQQAAPQHMTWLEFHLRQARLAARGPDAHLQTLRGRGGRCDIFLCWTPSKEPHAAFEVKRDVASLHTLKADTKRIIDLMNGGVAGDTLQFGAVVFSTMAECVHGEKIIRNRVALLRERLHDWRRAEGYEHMRLNIIRGRTKRREAGDYWAPLALVCERERRADPDTQMRGPAARRLDSSIAR